MSKILVAIALLVPLVSLLVLFGWPDITPYLTAFTVVLGYLYTWNKVLPIVEAYNALLIVLSIEAAIFAYKTIAKFIQFVSGHKTP